MMEQQTIIYLGITLLGIALTAGVFMGSSKSNFAAIKTTLDTMQQQIQEVRDDQKSINELTTRMAVVERQLTNVEKCQDHIQTDMTIIKKRQSRKTEE